MAPCGELRGKGRCGVFAGKTVWSTPERLRGKVLTTKRYTNLRLPLHKNHQRITEIQNNNIQTSSNVLTACTSSMSTLRSYAVRRSCSNTCAQQQLTYVLSQVLLILCSSLFHVQNLKYNLTYYMSFHREPFQPIKVWLKNTAQLENDIQSVYIPLENLFRKPKLDTNIPIFNQFSLPTDSFTTIRP